MKYFLAVLLVGVFAAPGNDGMAVTGPFGGSPTPKLSPAALAPAAVTTLRVVGATDTSLVLTWTEVSTAGTGIAKYVVRYDTAAAKFTDWGSEPEVSTGGCAAPVYGSTAGGGKVRACVLGGLKPHRYYEIAVRAFTGTMNLNAVYGPVSNVASGITAERIGPMLIQRPGVKTDSAYMRQVWFSAPGYSQDTFPMKGWFNVGDYLALAFVGDSVVLKGYLLVVRP